MAVPITELLQVVELAAIAAVDWTGKGDGEAADHAAVEAMRKRLDGIDVRGRVVIGEGERDEAPMLYVGEEFGAGSDDAPAIDIAVDPLEGTNLCAFDKPGATAVLAASERGGLLHAPDIYMQKLIVGPAARDVIDLDAPVSDNLAAIAGAYNLAVEELTVVVLERERHRELIADLRRAGARVRLIGDGDLGAGLSASVPGTGVHAVFGTGGAPEGVLSAAAARCLGGEILARLTPLNPGQEERIRELELEADLDRVYTSRDLASGDDVVFVAAGVTDGAILRGVRSSGGAHRVHSVVMSSSTDRLEFVDSIHPLSAWGGRVFGA